jgi:hypothetical protein
MLDEATRAAILRLREEGHGTRTIARVLHLSRGAVKRVCNDGAREVPRLERDEKAEPYRDQILELYASCKGNLVRVHEEPGTTSSGISPSSMRSSRGSAISATPSRSTVHPSATRRTAERRRVDLTDDSRLSTLAPGYVARASARTPRRPLPIALER